MNQTKKEAKTLKGSLAVAVVAGVLLVAGAVVGGVMIFNSASKTEKANDSQSQSERTSPKDKPRSESVLLFDQAEKTVTVGEKFSLSSMIDPKGKKVGAAELHIVFDPKILKMESAAPSDIFSLILSEAKIDNERGTASIILGVPLGKESVSLVSPIAIFSFQAVSSARKTNVVFSDKSMAAAEGESSNVITSMTNAVIQVK